MNASIRIHQILLLEKMKKNEGLSQSLGLEDASGFKNDEDGKEKKEAEKC